MRTSRSRGATEDALVDQAFQVLGDGVESVGVRRHDGHARLAHGPDHLCHVIGPSGELLFYEKVLAGLGQLDPYTWNFVGRERHEREIEILLFDQVVDGGVYRCLGIVLCGLGQLLGGGVLAIGDDLDPLKLPESVDPAGLYWADGAHVAVLQPDADRL